MKVKIQLSALLISVSLIAAGCSKETDSFDKESPTPAPTPTPAHAPATPTATPKLALEYVAEYNVNKQTTGFTTTQTDGEENAYMNWEKAMELFKNTQIPAFKKYHLPSKEEWAGICPANTNSISFKTVSKKTDKAEKITIAGETQTYIGEYNNMGSVKGISTTYAIRYKGNGNTRLSAWKYTYAPNPESVVNNGKMLVVEAIHLGESFTGTLEEISKESFWAERTSKIVKRKIPACGVFNVGEDVSFRGTKSHYWSSTEDVKPLAWFMEFRSEYTFTYSHAIHPSYNIRLFANE